MFFMTTLRLGGTHHALFSCKLNMATFIFSVNQFNRTKIYHQRFALEFHIYFYDLCPWIPVKWQYYKALRDFHFTTYLLYLQEMNRLKQKQATDQ